MPVKASLPARGSGSAPAGAQTSAVLRPLRVLVVEDNLDHAELISAFLRRREAGPWETEHADCLTAAVERLGQGDVDVVLLDMNLPDSRGLDTVSRFCSRVPEVPVVVVTALDDENTGVEALHRGAQDYLIKGKFEGALLGRSLRFAIERKRGEAAMARLAAIVEASDDAIIGITLDGVVTTWNSGAEQLFGYTAPEASGRSITTLCPPERAQALLERLERVRAGEHVEPGETVILAKDSTTSDVSLTLSPLRVGRGPITGASVIARSIRERKKAAEALRDSESRYRLLFENVPQPMWVYDEASLRILAVNEAACEAYGYSREEFLSMTVRDVRAPGEVPPMLQDVGPLRDPFGLTGLRKHHKKDGTLIDVEVTSHSFAFDDAAARLVLASDVTQRRRLEEQLLQSQKMEAVGRLAGGVAHDFNNVLGVITGYGELVRRGLDPKSALRRRMDEVLRATDRATELTHQLLAFSRKQVLEPKVLNLNSVTVEMDRMLRRLIGDDIRLEIQLDERLGQVLADRSQVAQIIVNLAVNARDAMPKGGTLAIRTANAELDIAAAREAGPGPYVMLEVSDTGSGMTPEVRARIFEPFFTTKPPGRGTGLGLATVYGIVRQSGGQIEVESELERGTAFRIYLPRVDGPAEGVTGEPIVPPEGGRETVLLAEDDRSLREMIAEVLQEAGYTVLVARNGDEALLMCERHASEVQLLLTDVVMPGMTGDALAERLAELRPELPVVYMSGYRDNTAGQGVLDPGVAFLQKPFTPDALLRKVRDVLDRARPSPAVH